MSHIPIFLVGQFRNIRASGSGPSIHNLLMMSRDKLTKEPVDKIYGILALMGEKGQLNIRVDYSVAAKETFWQLYADTCKDSLERDGFRILDLALSTEKHPDLPTWCPDFRYTDTRGSFSSQLFHSGEFEAHERSHNPSPAVRIPGMNTMDFRGLEMDKIAFTLEHHFEGIASMVRSPANAKTVLECEGRCLELSKSICSAFDSVPLAHIVTLVAALRTPEMTLRTFSSQRKLFSYNQMAPRLGQLERLRCVSTGTRGNALGRKIQEFL